MKKLTQEDIQKIALYAPFRIRFEPILCKSLFDSRCATAMIGSVVVFRYDEEDREAFRFV